MLKAFKYRCYPTNTQKDFLEKHFGCTRFVYNKALQLKIIDYQLFNNNLSRFDLQKIMKDWKDTEYPWLKEVNSQSLQVSLLNLDNAYKKFFKEKSGFPKFKSKHGGLSFQCPQSVQVEYEGKHSKVFIPKLKEGLSVIMERNIKGAIKSATISKTTTNKYFISILCETGDVIPEKKSISNTNAIGIDLGLKDFAITSDGVVYANPKYLKEALNSLKTHQRRLAKKVKGSNRYKKSKLKLAKCHEHITNQRSDFLHKLSTEITNQYDTICVEDLNVKGMIKNHKLAQGISDVGWSMFVSQLEYKSLWKGKNLIKCGRFDASSKTCHVCGYIKKDLKLSDREWVCPVCGEIHDRDFNAAVNIKHMALKKVLVERQFKDVEMSSVDIILDNEGQRPEIMKHLVCEASNPLL